MTLIRSIHRVAIATVLAGLSATAFGQADACAQATLIGVGTYSGNTTSATNDGQASCVGSRSKDVWYKFIPDRSDRDLEIQMCGGSTWDTLLSVHSGCPGTAANSIACNDDSCGLQSRLTLPVTAGTQYYIRVAAYDSATAGAYTLGVAYVEPPPPPTLGPDVWIEDFTDIAYYATAGGIGSYAIGTDACNQGDAPAEWQSGNNRHPVIAQNLFRLKDGRFEQIGQSWLKHGFASTNSGACGSCQQPPGGGSQLGLRCSDAYGAGLNGSQGNLGPRSLVNVTTGVFPYPYSAPGYTGDIMRRIQVRTTDVTAAQNPGALYFGECHYVTQDDAQWNNGLNNSSYRRVSFSTPSNPQFAAAIVRQQPAIHAWPANDPSVTLATMDYTEPNPLAGHGPITARFWIAAKATDNGNGTWTYEYAIENFNANRAGGGFTVPLPTGAHVTNIGFHDVDSHSGEPFDNTDWTTQVTPFGVSFRPAAFTPAVNANALRWGTLYNFRFTADVRPASGNVSLDLFLPGTPSTVFAAVPAPDLFTCIGDFNHDGGIDGSDVNAFFEAFEAGVPSADVNQDGGVDGSDAETFFIAWADGRC